jgi:serine/threonine protein kinase
MDRYRTDAVSDRAPVGAGGGASTVMTMPRGERSYLDAEQRLSWRSSLPLAGDQVGRFREHLSGLRALEAASGVCAVSGGVDADGHGWLATPRCPETAATWLATGPASLVAVGRAADCLARGLAALYAADLRPGTLTPGHLLVDTAGGIRLTPPPPEPAAPDPAYAPVEIMRGAGPSPASDAYAVAATLYALLAGGPPHATGDGVGLRAATPDAPELARSDVPAGVRRLLALGLAADPGERPPPVQLAAEIADLLLAPAERADGPGGAGELGDVSLGGSSVQRTSLDGDPLDVAVPDHDEAMVLPPAGRTPQDTLPPTSPLRTEVGTPLGSGYLLDAVIGSGTTGRVWQGRRRDDGSPVAVKVLRAEVGADPGAVQRFLRESSTLRAVSHPHLVRIHDLVAEGDTLAIVMDLVDGEDLRKLASRAVLSGPAALTILSQVAAALAEVHAAGIVHRDIKPENILVDWQDGAPYARLTDFGLAWAADSPTLTRASQLVGTPAYVAPELVSGRPVGPSVDVYALGVTAYELLSGERPYDAKNPAALLAAHVDRKPRRPAAMTDDLWEVLKGCLAKDPASRPTAEQLAPRFVALAGAQQAPPLPPRRDSSWSDPRTDRPGSSRGAEPLAADAPAGSVAPAAGDAAASVGATVDPATSPSASVPVAPSGASLASSQPTTGATRPVPAAPPSPPPRRRWRAWVLAGLGIAMVGVAAGLWFGRPAPDPGPVSTPKPPAAQGYYLQVVATTPKNGTVRLTFPDVSDTAGFDSYVIFRDAILLDQIDGGVAEAGSYTIPGVDSTTEHCYRVFALVETNKALPKQDPTPACVVADGKSR